MKVISATKVRILGVEVLGVETSREQQVYGLGGGLERVRAAYKITPDVDPDLLKPIARKAAAYLEPFDKKRVQSDPSFDESLASPVDIEIAYEKLKELEYTPKGIQQLTYSFLLLGPLSEQKDVAPIFKGAIRNVIEDLENEVKKVISHETP